MERNMSVLSRLQKSRLAAPLSVAIACLAFGSYASANLVVDPSFELGTPSGPENTGGWDAVNGASINTNPLYAHTGNNSLEVDNGGAGINSGVPLAFQTTNIGVTGGAEFVLTAYGMTTGPMAPANASTNYSTSFAGIQATFYSGDNGSGNNLGTVQTGAGNAVFSNHIDSTSPVGTWIPLTTGVFTAPAGAESLTVYGIAVFPQEQNAGTGIYEDDFDLEPVNVPEPASLGLLAAGGFSLLIRRRRA
jgi:hypothetical protein